MKYIQVLYKVDLDIVCSTTGYSIKLIQINYNVHSQRVKVYSNKPYCTFRSKLKYIQINIKVYLDQH